MNACIVASVIGWIAKAMKAGRGSSALLLSCVGLTSCMYVPLPACLTLSPLEEAASYDWMLNDRHYSEPLNTWVKNERLERFLLKSYRSGGIEALKSQFGFECEPKAVVPTCADCFTCRKSLPKQVAQQEEIPTGHLCSKSGEMLMQIDSGPGRDVLTAMTNWERPPLTPQAGN